eukprot:c20335_g1_i6.p1 GENE.c20335_g1_i6~~c20335_g1_i6.p1  ORF type:complete len:130 (-),score=28.84 c20335_g1_i6:195-584(-)
MTTAYFRGAQGVVLVFDTTNASSFASLTTWLKHIEDNAPESIIKVVVGTKIDEEGRRQVSKAEALAFCQKIGVDYFEVSSKTGSNVTGPFEHIAGVVVRRFEQFQQDSPSIKLSPRRKNPRAKSKCCGK